MPWAPAAETAKGLKFDSAISWAASSAAETFQWAAARSKRRAEARRDEGGQPGAAGEGAVSPARRAVRPDRVRRPPSTAPDPPSKP